MKNSAFQSIRQKMTRLLILLPVITLVSCQDDNPDPDNQWSNSVFVVNEGPFQAGSGTVMAYDRITGEVSGDLFEAANGRPLGNIVQSLTVHENLVFIAVNNSNKIEIVDIEDFKSTASIEGLALPRYIMGVGKNSVAVSCWDNTLRVISLVDFTVTDSLATGTGPDEMVMSGEDIFVINSGGYGVDSTISVLSSNGGNHFGLVEVGHRPSGIVADHEGRLWILCSGKGWNGFPQPGDTPGRLICMDPGTRSILKTFNFTDSGKHPEQLVINREGDVLYFLHPEGIYKFPVDAATLPSAPFITHSASFYGIGYDPSSEIIYASDPLDYAQNGRVHRFDAATGQPLDSFLAGLIPNGFWFN
jgi:DNA-binding beta-propeller fold protein YncE